jgi:DNA repair exonuclease SbcCD nuclease subunit
MRLAQITDLHLPFIGEKATTSGDRNGDDYGLFARTLEKAVSLGADACVVTGDLLDLRWDKPGPRINRTQVKESYYKIKGILDAFVIPHLALPGNHDHEGLFWKIFNRLKNHLQVNGYEIACFFDAEGRTHIPHRRGGELSRFKKLCAERDGLPQIHVQHYLLTDPPENDYPYSYSNRTELRRRITGSGKVILCISGHYHKGTDLICNSGCCYTAGVAWHTPEKKFRIYDIRENQVTYHNYHI